MRNVLRRQLSRDSAYCNPECYPSATRTREASQDAEQTAREGRWLSFPRVPHLLPYVSTGTYFARVKVDGKTIRRSPSTS
jgi:hypothetical protein